MGIVNITGVSGSRVAPVCGKIIEESTGQILILTPTFMRASKLASDLSFFVKKNVYLLPSDNETFTFFDAKNKDSLIERLKIIKKIFEEKDCVVVAPINGAIKKMPPKEVFEKYKLAFEINKSVSDVKNLVKKLVDMGYERVSMVYAKGQFSMRGSILDIYTPYNEEPYRIEFFDDEVESIRTFDVIEQRSIEKLNRIEIFQSELLAYDKVSFERAKAKIASNYKNQVERKEDLINAIDNLDKLQQLENYLDYFYDATENLADYMEDAKIIFDDPNRMHEYLETRAIEYKMDFTALLEKGKVVKKDFDNFPGTKELLELYKNENIYLISPFQKKINGIDTYDELVNISSMECLSYNGKLDLLARELRKYLERSYKVTIACSTLERANNIKEFLKVEGLEDKIEVKEGVLSEGMDFPKEKFAIITDRDIFGTQKNRKRVKSKNSKSKQIKTFTEIKKGDFVVHENHGVGKFIGIKKLELQGIQKDYIQIKYAGNDMLYVPVEQMDLVQKYVGSETITPRINRLSGSDWKNTKAKAKAAIASMAKELIELSAARVAKAGHQFSPDTPWQREFEDDFPYEETADQLRCIEEIKADMEKPEAMDRLLCGDVGYGKTEVAARAMFKCATEGKQVAVLVPTTVLASQHYNTLKARFEKFPFKVEMLSRFRTDHQQKLIIEATRRGEVDVLIGTHRLLSEDVKFKDLGLLVIDEEQRFGVAHKEKIKSIKDNVDVLTLSATPIPRTLHMSLVGIRDMSLIEEPPEERFPVQTYVMEEEDFVIREAIEREVDRNGQVFVIYNKVRGIKRIAKQIEDLVPGKVVSVLHGQMSSHAIEDVMMDFVNGNGDVLVATTIIESGIDIPNVNTEIIIDADHFGLSQLYQLRGRVGRSSKLGYAYLMHKKAKSLTEIGEKRLRAIKEFTEFGAGFKIAMRDLEIRGAGNLLGSEQHGHLISVGYELYCKLVDEAVAALRGEIIKDEKEEAILDIKVPAYIPDTYISDEVTKLAMYRSIAEISTKEERVSMLAEIEDRFGNAPSEVINLLEVSLIKSLAENLDIQKVFEKGNQVQFSFASNGVKPIVIYKTSGIPVLEDIRDFLEKLNEK
ncbi:MAG: transcription-repair coupling factor [Anaerovoracaceae bacterium]